MALMKQYVGYKNIYTMRQKYPGCSIYPLPNPPPPKPILTISIMSYMFTESGFCLIHQPPQTKYTLLTNPILSRMHRQKG